MSRQTSHESDPAVDAKSARLRYVHADEPGISRRHAGKGFVYFDAKGRRVRDVAVLDRIHKLVIPPAWKDVWICESPTGHLQATGRDARGRKQYRYHSRWRKVRDETKYDHMVEFGKLLPRIRARVRRDLKLPGMPKNKVLAIVVRLLEDTCIRVGNEEYARDNGSFGLTTLRDRHVSVRGRTVRFSFDGKSGTRHHIELNDRRLARLVRRCRDVTGQELFQYIDEDGQRHPISSTDVNEYLHEISNADLTAKDFRTWAGTLLALHSLTALGVRATQRQAKAVVVRAVKAVAEQLGNTVSVCRKNYIHPRVIEAYLDGDLLAGRNAHQPPHRRGLRTEEAALLKFLKAAS